MESTGSGVLRTVAAIASAFQTAADALQVLKTRKEKKKRRKDKEIEELYEIRILHKSLVDGATNCKKHCQEQHKRYGAPFENGDAIAVTALLDVLVLLQTDVISALHIVGQGNDVSLDFTKIHESSVTSRKDVIRALDGLCQRIAGITQYGPQPASNRPEARTASDAGIRSPSLPQPPNNRPEARTTSDASMRSPLKNVHSPDPNEYSRTRTASDVSMRSPQVKNLPSPNPTEYSKKTLPSLPSDEGGHSSHRRVVGQYALPQDTLHIRRPSDSTDSRGGHQCLHGSPRAALEHGSTSQVSPQDQQCALSPQTAPHALGNSHMQESPYALDPYYTQNLSQDRPRPDQALPQGGSQPTQSLPQAAPQKVSSNWPLSSKTLQENPPIEDMTIWSEPSWVPGDDQSNHRGQSNKTPEPRSPVSISDSVSQVASVAEEPIHYDMTALSGPGWAPDDGEQAYQALEDIKRERRSQVSELERRSHVSVQESLAWSEKGSESTQTPNPASSHFFSYDPSNSTSPSSARDPQSSTSPSFPRDNRRFSIISEEGATEQLPRYSTQGTGAIHASVPHMPEKGGFTNALDVAEHPAHRVAESDVLSIASSQITRRSARSRIERPEDLLRVMNQPEVLSKDFGVIFAMRPFVSSDAARDDPKYLAYRTESDYAESLFALSPGMDNIWLPMSRPAMHNRYHGFCKGAWLTRKAVHEGLEIQITTTEKAPIIHWACKFCKFQSKAPNIDAMPDQILFNQKYGVRYRWLFLAKSHQHADSSLTTVETYRYGCIFCAANGQTTALHDRLDHLMVHIVSKHKTWMMTPDIRKKTKCFVGSVADKAGDWDINVADSNPKGAGYAADEFFIKTSKFLSRKKKR